MYKHNLSIFSSDRAKIITIILLQLTVVFFFLMFCWKIVMPEYTYDYLASINDKMEYLESIDEPKIVLVGNSNLAFGMNSTLLEKEFGMPVVNLGLHGALGNVFHERMIYGHVNKGDIVIICHTDYGDNGKIGDSTLAWVTLENNKRLWKLISTEDYYDMAISFPNYLKKSLKLWITEEGNFESEWAYSRTAFNKNGDDVFPRPEHNYTFDETTGKTPGLSEKCINRINELNQYVVEQGGTLLIAGYPIGDGKYTESKEKFEQFEEQLRDKMDEPVISHFTDYFMDYQYFADTEYHLTDEGVQIRTKQLIKDLKNWYKNERGHL